MATPLFDLFFQPLVDALVTTVFGKSLVGAMAAV
jgi:hypothetical protein